MHTGREDFVVDMTRFMNHVNRLQNYACNKTKEENQIFVDQQEALIETASKLMNKYIEEWRLVIKLVPEIVAKSLDTLDRLSPLEPAFDITLSILKNVANCIGIKRIGRYWPTEVAWLTKLIEWTELYLDIAKDRSSSIFTLTLWLASAVKTPFALDRFNQPEKLPTSSRFVPFL